MICTIPRVAVDAGAAARRAPRSTGTACWAAAGEVGRATSRRWARSTTSCSARPTGRACRPRTSANVGLLLQDLSTFNTLVDRIQQGDVNFLYLGRWLIHPDGASAHCPPSRWAGSRVDRRRRAVLRRQQPGRDPRRRADRAVARLPGRRARRARHELLDPAAPQRGLRHRTPTATSRASSSRSASTRLPERARAPAVLSLMQLLWDRGESNGYAQHMTNDPLPEHPAAPRAAAPRASATTRWPTCRPRWRRARSAPAPTARRTTAAGRPT